MKKLNAIEALKMRQAGGEKLEVSQVSKMELDDQVSNELDALNEEVEKRNISLLIGHYSLIVVRFDPHRHVSQLFMNSTLLGYMATFPITACHCLFAIARTRIRRAVFIESRLWTQPGKFHFLNIGSDKTTPCAWK